MQTETTLHPHQSEFLKNHIGERRVVLYWDCRTGKSITGQKWMEHRAGKKLIICIKKNKKEWQTRAPDMLVYTKEEIKKVPLTDLQNISAILIDEVHFLAGSLFIAKTRSDLSKRMYDILDQNPDTDLIALSATPITNAYYSLHTLLVYLNIAPKWKEYQNHMTNLIRNPFNGRGLMWMAKPDWRIRARAITDKHKTYFHRVRLQDCVKSLPPEIVNIETVKGGGLCDCDNCHWTHNHKLEQKNKIKWVKEHNFDKLIIACHYREQVQEVSKVLAKCRTVYTVYGGTQNQEETIKAWEKDPFGYLVISASMGEAFEGCSADALIFMSIPHRVLSHTQMKDRLTTLDTNKIKPKLYFYLIGGAWDKKIFNSVVKAQKDFYGETS